MKLSQLRPTMVFCRPTSTALMICLIIATFFGLWVLVFKVPSSVRLRGKHWHEFDCQGIQATLKHSVGDINSCITSFCPAKCRFRAGKFLVAGNSSVLVHNVDASLEDLRSSLLFIVEVVEDLQSFHPPSATPQACVLQRTMNDTHTKLRLHIQSGRVRIAIFSAATNMVRAHVAQVHNVVCPLRLLFYIPKSLYESRGNMDLREQVDAFASSKMFDVWMSGDGFADWNSSDVHASVHTRFHGPPDIVYVRSGGGGVGVATEIKRVYPNIRTMIRYHECWKHRCMPITEGADADIVMYGYTGDLVHDIPLFPDDDKRVYVHVPMSANKAAYFENPGSLRNTTVLLIGALNNNVYPLRSKLAQAINRGTIKGNLLDHWGHRASVKKLNRQDWHYKQREEYSKALRGAKITIITSSVYDYQLQKYAEALLSGTLMMGSVPQDNARLWKQCVIPLSLHDTSERMNREINYWLTHDEERIAHVKRCQAAGLKYSMWGNTIVQLAYESFHRHVRQDYGVVFPYSFDYRLPRAATCNWKESADAGRRCSTQWDEMRETVDNFDVRKKL